jgi:hypothetical protein
MPFAVQNMMILLAPVLFAASIYMTLGRVIRHVDGEKHSMVRLKWLTKLFVTGDIFCLVVQGGAAGLMIVSELAKIGQGIVVAGLVIQILIFGLFCLTTLLFHRRMLQDPAAAYIPVELRWQHNLWVLYTVSTLIMVRSIFRVIEFIMGNDGYLLSIEWPVYVFDSGPMLAVMIIFYIWFPSSAESNSNWTPLRVVSRSVVGETSAIKPSGLDGHGSV